MIDSETVTLDVLKGPFPATPAERVSIVARALSTRASVLVLGGMEIRATQGALELAATDMELSLRASVEADTMGAGTVVVPGRLLLDIARSLPEPDATLEHLPDESLLLITSGSASYRIHTYSAEDFPNLPDLEGAALQQVDGEALLSTIGRVSKSASRDESRPVLTGVFVSFEGDKLVMAATDSYRLAVKETAAPGPLPELEAIIPARALQSSSDCRRRRQHRARRPGEPRRLRHRRCVADDAPHRRPVPELPPAAPGAVRARARAAARGAPRRRAPRLPLAQRNSPLRLRFADGELTVSARTQDVGEARESLPAPYAADALEIAFNAEFLRDGLDSIDSSTVRVKLINPLRPGPARQGRAARCST